MKTVIKLGVTLSAFLTLSCSKPAFWELPNNVRVVAHTENLSTGSIAWNDKDSLTIIDAAGISVPCAIESAGKNFATFYTYKWTGATPIYAVFPADSQTRQTPGLCVTLPAEYEVSAREQCASFASVGKLTGSRNIFKALPMKNVMGLVSVNVPAADVTSVRLEAIGGEAMSGQVAVDYEALASDEPLFWSPVEGRTSPSVSITPRAGSEISDAGVFAEGDYYISALPQLYAQGFRITMTTLQGAPLVVEKRAPATLSRNALYLVGDTLPDDITLSLDFLNEDNVNPLGEFVAWADQDASGVDHTYSYHYESEGYPMTADFTFTLYGGSKYSYESKVQDISGKLLHVATGGKWAIKLPAIKGRCLKSVSFTHTGTTFERRFRLQEGYPTPGRYFSASATPSSQTSLATATVSIPTGATDAAQISDTKENTPYCVQLTSNAAYNITNITVTYIKK